MEKCNKIDSSRATGIVVLRNTTAVSDIFVSMNILKLLNGVPLIVYPTNFRFGAVEFLLRKSYRMIYCSTKFFTN